MTKSELAAHLGIPEGLISEHKCPTCGEPVMVAWPSLTNTICETRNLEECHVCREKEES